jgi:putative endopeptidase
MTISALSEKCGGGFDFASYFAALTNDKDLGEINVRNTDALERMASVVSSVDPAVLKHYLCWIAVKTCAPYLSKVFVDENFDFYEKMLTGTQEIKPRWKRAMAFTETALGEALGQLYCAKHFDESSKERALAIVENVREALEGRLKEVEWMTSDETRAAALNKMAGFKVKIGYPDKWIDYTPLDLQNQDSFLTMVFKASAFEHARDVKEMNAPTDRQKWVSATIVCFSRSCSMCF